jgi:hypothetical protein
MVNSVVKRRVSVSLFRSDVRDVLLAESVDRVEQLNVLEQVGGKDKYLLVSKRHEVTVAAQQRTQ